MRVLIFEPGYSPYIAFFKNSTEAVAQTIQGGSRTLLPFDNEVIALVCSEQQAGLPLNRSINEQKTVRGRFLVCGWDGSGLRELTKKQADRYYRRYMYPETFVDTGSALLVVPQNPRVKPADERLGRKKWRMER